MNDKLTYLTLSENLTKFSKNIDLIISNINNFERICSSALILNDSTSYKNSVVNLKYTLDCQKEKIEKEILIELKQNI